MSIRPFFSFSSHRSSSRAPAGEAALALAVPTLLLKVIRAGPVTLKRNRKGGVGGVRNHQPLTCTHTHTELSCIGKECPSTCQFFPVTFVRCGFFFFFCEGKSFLRAVMKASYSLCSEPRDARLTAL